MAIDDVPGEIKLKEIIIMKRKEFIRQIIREGSVKAWLFYQRYLANL